MEPTEHNRRAWDEVHRRRTRAMAGELGIPAHLRPYLPDISGRHVLHLQCAAGEDTAELVELGALVTAVDVSSEALVIARERVPDALFIAADVQELPLELRRGRFDFVYTGGGVLAWLHDLDAWAGGIVSALRPGGRLLLHDGHPVVQCLDQLLRWRDDYFDERPIVNVGWEHFPLAGEPAHEEKVERFWRLGQVVNALADAGLVVRRLDEFPASFHWTRRDARVPGEFVLIADKAPSPG